MRKSVLARESTLNGSFSPWCEMDSIPGPLMAAVGFLMYGSSKPSDCKATTPLLTVCQIIFTNMKASMPKGDIVRHSPKREAPLLLYNGLAAYGRNRDKQLIKEMHDKGMCVSPNRVTAVTSQLCRMVVKRAEEEKVVCPSNLRKNLFTTAAIDNFDVRATSLSGKGEFHGTSISIFQHPTREEAGEIRTFRTNYMDVKDGGERSVPELPDCYASVPDCVLPCQQPIPPESSLEAASKVAVEGNLNVHLFFNFIYLKKYKFLILILLCCQVLVHCFGKKRNTGSLVLQIVCLVVPRNRTQIYRMPLIMHARMKASVSSLLSTAFFHFCMQRPLTQEQLNMEWI